MLTVTMTGSFILFDSEYYRQRNGVAMVSRLGPTFTNIFLCVGLKKAHLNLDQ